MTSHGQFTTHMDNIRRYVYLRGQHARLTWLMEKYAEEHFTERLEREFVEDVAANLKALAVDLRNDDFMGVMTYWMELSKKYWDDTRRRRFMQEVDKLRKELRELPTTSAGQAGAIKLATPPDVQKYSHTFTFWCPACESEWGANRDKPDEDTTANGTTWNNKRLFQTDICPYCGIRFSAVYFTHSLLGGRNYTSPEDARAALKGAYERNGLTKGSFLKSPRPICLDCTRVNYRNEDGYPCAACSACGFTWGGMYYTEPGNRDYQLDEYSPGGRDVHNTPACPCCGSIFVRSVTEKKKGYDFIKVLVDIRFDRDDQLGLRQHT